MTGIPVPVFLLLLYSSLVCCEVPQLKIEQNKNIFCPGETARLICQWENVPVSFWKVNGTVTTTGGLNRMAGHNASTSLTEGFTRVSITQTQPSVTSYICIASVDEDFPSDVVYVTFRGTQCLDSITCCSYDYKHVIFSDSPLELSILYMRKETSLLVLLNVTSEGCPPPELVRITVNNVSLTGRLNNTFGFEGLSPGESYTVRVKTQVKGEGFSLYEEIPVHVYDESNTDGM